MTGLILSVFFGAFLYFLRHRTPTDIFLNATGFLLWWYIIKSVILVFVYLAIASLAVKNKHNFKDNLPRSWQTYLVKLLIGETISVLIIILLTLKQNALIIAAYLMHSSLTFTAGDAEWEPAKLIIGSLLLLLLIIPYKNW